MRVLLFGADGQLGYELEGALGVVADVIRATRREIDFTEIDRLREFVGAAAPQVIVNAAAQTDVDGAERAPDVADRVNFEAVAALGEEARRRRVPLVHYSTDFVFDGLKGNPYVETDPTCPVNAYGRSKLRGERALLEMGAPAIILRTAWVYGLRRKCFVTAILQAAREREELRVVSDQIGNPTFCRDLAQATALLIHAHRSTLAELGEEARGVYHVAGTGSCSRHELANAILEIDPRRSEHKVRRVDPIASSEDGRLARRPTCVPLETSAFHQRFGIRLPPWRDALRRALQSDVRGT